MFLFIIILVMFVLVGLKIRKEEEGVLSHKDTTTINGIFVICIFVSHSTQYFLLTNSVLDTLELTFQNFHNQWVVATFLAFSGYGVMKQIMVTGENYLKRYPVNRILKTLVHFDIAVIVYIFVNSIMRQKYNILTIVLSFLGITGIGNSNWYVFVILLMYIITYIAAVLSNREEHWIASGVTFFTIIYILSMSIIGGESRFFSTALCYPLGIWIAVYKNKIINGIRENKILSFVFISILLVITYKLRWNDCIMNISSCAFVMLVVWLDTLFEIRSDVLYFLGKHAFSIYILQRIPMMLISKYLPCITNINVLGTGVSLCATVVMAVVFDRFLKWFDIKVFIK